MDKDTKISSIPDNLEDFCGLVEQHPEWDYNDIVNQIVEREHQHRVASELLGDEPELPLKEALDLINHLIDHPEEINDNPLIKSMIDDYIENSFDGNLTITGALKELKGCAEDLVSEKN